MHDTKYHIGISKFLANWSLLLTTPSGGSIKRKLDCSARFGPSSDQSSLPSIARSLPSDNKNKHNQMAAILKRTCDRQDTLFLTSGVNYSV